MRYKLSEAKLVAGVLFLAAAFYILFRNDLSNTPVRISEVSLVLKLVGVFLVYLAYKFLKATRIQS